MNVSTMFGSPSWTRTSDIRINSPVFYQLNYQGINSTYNDILLLYRQSVSSVIKSKNPNLLSKAFNTADSHKNHQMLLGGVTTQYVCVSRVSTYKYTACRLELRIPVGHFEDHLTNGIEPSSYHCSQCMCK